MSWVVVTGTSKPVVYGPFADQPTAQDWARTHIATQKGSTQISVQQLTDPASVPAKA